MNTKANLVAHRPNWKRLWLVMLTVSILLLVGLILVHGIHRVDPKRVRSTISRNLSPGADKDTVLRFLDSEHIHHSNYLPEYSRIYAEIDRSTIGLIKGHIHMEFNFGADGRLQSYEVKELFDSF
jgi:hypothetical protein